MDHCSHHSSGVGGVYQSLDELDFSRGPWNAAINGDLPAIQKYFDKGGEPNVTDSSGYTCLHYAAANGNLSICQEMLRNRANVNRATRSGKSTALHRAALKGHHKIVEYLLESGADATLVDADVKTPLHKAAEGNNAECCKLLIEAAPEMQSVLDIRGKYPKNYVQCTNEQKNTYKALWWRQK